MKEYVRKIAVLSGLALIILAGCDDDSGNHAPEIVSINLDPSGNFIPGYDIVISADVNDSDGDPLEYLWESTGGDIVEPDQNPATWELYTTAEPFSYEAITLTVSDGKSSVTRTRTIQVGQGLTVSGTTCYSGTTIPVPGATVSIGKYTTTSGEDGSYVVKSLREGYHQVTASKDGFDLFEASEYVDNPLSIYNISMTSPTLTSRVTGVINTLDNITLEGLKVSLLNPDDSESALTGFTGEAGTYEIPGVPHGSRKLLIRSDVPESHFLNDSLIFEIELDGMALIHDVRIKTLRTVISDSYLSQQEKWIFDGDVSDGFYLLGKGHQLKLKDFIDVPEDAEKATLYLNSFVVGGCDMIGILPSHRVWISNAEGEYMGGISWGGEGNNFEAKVSWIPSDQPTFLDIYGKQLKLNLELFGENNCIPNPQWRIYEVGFNYYH